MKEVRYLDKKMMSVHFTGDDFHETLALVKSLTGRTYNPSRKCWNVPILSLSIENLIKWGFGIDEKLENWYIEEDKKQEKQLELDFPEELGLYEFQKEGVAFLERMDGRGLIADQPGLGKTCQSLVYSKRHPELRPIIIVCPATLKINWNREIEKWGLGDSVCIINGRRNINNNYLEDRDIYIINYDILFDISKTEKVDDKKIKTVVKDSGWVKWLKKLKPEIIILDEVHKISNMKNLRTKAVRKLCKGVDRIIALTGTPIMSKPKQIFSVLNLLNKELFPGFWNFGMRYCDPKHNGFGWNWDGASNIEELHEILTTSIMLRRLKKDVLKDLPSKQIAIVPLEIDNRIDYDHIEEDLEGIARYEKLKQIAIQGKLNNCIRWIEDFLESGEKLVVFATHHKTIDLLKAHFDKVSVKLDGRDNIAERQLSVEKFQTYNDIKLFLGNIEAGGVGITLTAASNVCFVEFSFVPAEMDQASDRIHRIGQEAGSVTIWNLVAENTIEEELFAILDSKRKIVDAIIDGRETQEDELLLELLQEFKDKYGMEMC